MDEPDATTANWVDWHLAYDIDNSPLHRRLAIVQRHIRDALDQCAPGLIRIISMGGYPTPERAARSECDQELRDVGDLGLGLVDGPRAVELRVVPTSGDQLLV